MAFWYAERMNPQLARLSQPMSYGDIALQKATLDDARALANTTDGSTFKYFTGIVPKDSSTQAMYDYLQVHLARPVVCFAVRFQGQVVACTSFMDLRLDQGGMEIGYTWISKDYRGTCVNPTMKYLMLQRGFEELGMERMQLKCNALNAASVAAITKLGAKSEGILRRYRIDSEGLVGDTHMFSIIKEEWPNVQAKLKTRLT